MNAMDEQDTSRKLTQKIEKICEQLGIRVEWLAITSPTPNRACKSERKISVRKIDDSGDYAAALHEIGHVINDPDVKSANALEILGTELNAWKWALENYRPDFDDKCWKRLHASLSQYKDRVHAVPHEHPVHSFLKEAESAVPLLNKSAAPDFRNMPLPRKGK